MLEEKKNGDFTRTPTNNNSTPLDINVSTEQNTPTLLQAALNDEDREKYGLCVIFVTKDKYPGIRGWQKYGKEKQTENEVEELHNKLGIRNTGYSYFTGIGGLIDIDFDWPWLYKEALRRFGDRFDTKTLRTPNGGYRILFITDNPDDFLDFKEKPPRVEVHGKPSHQVVVYGSVLDDYDNIKSYNLVNNTEIRYDANILTDFKKFLNDIVNICFFLQYPCIQSQLNGKYIELTQEQRTSIGSLFAAENIDIELATEFYSCTDDFDTKKTREHLKRLYDKGFKHPTCETLRKNFNWDKKKCKGCPRLRNNQCTIKDENSEDIKMKSFDLLKTPDLLKQVKIAMEEKNVDKSVIGEEQSSLTLFLNCVGSLNDIQTINTLKGSSSAGKTAVANMVTGLFHTKKVGDLSPTALKHGTHDYHILYMQESVDGDFESKHLRLISADDGGFIAETTIKDKETGEYSVQRDVIPVRTLVTTSTTVEIHNEFGTRSFIIPLDESQQQTENIIDYTFGESGRILDEIMGKKTFGEKYSRLKNALTFLEPYEIIIPYEELLTEVFPSIDLRARRDSKKLIQLIKCSAFLYQYQRPNSMINGHNILIANVQDLYNVLTIAGPILESTLTGFDTRTLNAIELIPEIIKEDKCVTTVNLSKKMDLSTNYASQILKQLREKDFLIINDILKEELEIKGRTYVHTLNPNKDSLESLISSTKDLDWIKFQKMEEKLVNSLIENGSEYTGSEEFLDPITGEKIPLQFDDLQINRVKENNDSEYNEKPNESLNDYSKDSKKLSEHSEDQIEGIDQLAIDAFVGGDEDANDRLGNELLKKDNKGDKNG